VPVQKNDVDYDVPDAKEIEKCTVEAETVSGITGWVVRDSGGQILRRFLDSNSDNRVDQCVTSRTASRSIAISTPISTTRRSISLLGTAGRGGDRRG